MKKINVFIVDDSAVVRELLTEHLSKHQSINIVGTALDPYIARNKIVKLPVDVIILDIEMPRMDGLTFLKYLMKSYPIPVIILSSIAKNSNAACVEALSLGAIDIVPKPGGPYSVGDVIDDLIEKIITASKVDFEKVKTIVKKRLIKTERSHSKILSKIKTTKKIIAVGASTGGTSALEILFREFEKNFPPTVCVIHMPERFTYTFAERLNEICEVRIKEAVNNEKALSGHVYIAPGNFHLKIKSVGADHIIKVTTGPKINNQRPAVDILFNSIADNAGKNSLGVILTGMGKDGASGLLNIKNAGGFTIAQDEASSIVFGMPKEAIELGAADKILPLDKITSVLKMKLQNI